MAGKRECRRCVAVQASAAHGTVRPTKSLQPPPAASKRTQYAPTPDTTPALSADDITRVQQGLGTLLYYGRAIDNTILTAVGSIATQQANGTAATMKAITHLLNYCATHPEATVRFIASDMVLWVDSDASYLSENKARSRAGGFHFTHCHRFTATQQRTHPCPMPNHA